MTEERQDVPPLDPSQYIKNLNLPAPPLSFHVTPINTTVIRGSELVDTVPTASSSATGMTRANRRTPILDISIEPDNEEIELARTPKKSSTEAIIINALKGHFLFSALGDNELADIVSVMSLDTVIKGTTVITQGEKGDRFFVMEHGNAMIMVNGVSVGVYEPGDSFGELALLYNCPRAASIEITSDSANLWSVDRTTFRRILATTAASAQVARVEFLRNVKLLQPLSNNQVQRVAAALKMESFSMGEHVISQGDDGDTFYLIVRGHVEVMTNNVVNGVMELKHVMHCLEGDYFGEMALMLNEPRHANVIVRSARLDCYTLNRAQFTELLGPLTEVLDRQMRIRVLRSVPLLQSLTDCELDLLAHALNVMAFTDGQMILREGDPGSIFYMVSDGTVSVQRDSVEVMKLSSGDFFGERALLTNESRAANCIAVGRVECLTLDRSSFERILGKLEHLLQQEMIRQQAMQEVAFHVTKPETDDDMERSTVDFSDLSLIRTIGTGSFGRVLIVNHLPTNNTYALKCMQKATIVMAHQQKNVIMEKTIIAECNHPFILKLISTYVDKTQIYMLLELVQGGELWSLLYEKLHLLPTPGPYGCLDMASARFYAANLVLIFEYFSRIGVAYRDLKPENLLIDHQGYLKMVDFGFAKHIPYYKTSCICPKSFTLCGTPEYLAPELVLSKGHSRAVDFWALGCLIYELLVGATPFQDDEQQRIFEKIVSVETTLKFPERFDLNAKDLITKLLHPNPALRLGCLAGGVQDIMTHPWFTIVNVQWGAMLKKELRAPFIPPIKDQHDSSNFDPYPEETVVQAYNGVDYFEGF